MNKDTNKGMKRVNLDIPISVAILGLVFLFYRTTIGSASPAYKYPRYVMGLIVLLCVLIIGSAIRRMIKPASGDKVSTLPPRAELIKAFGCFALIAAYIALIKFITFFPATVLFIPSIMLLFGMRSVKAIALLTVILTAFIYVFFVLQLKVMLP